MMDYTERTDQWLFWTEMLEREEYAGQASGISFIDTFRYMWE